MAEDVIYLDNNATSRVAPEVLEAMLPYFKDRYGNPSSMHLFGGRIHQDVEKARAEVAALLGADPSEIIFVSCGTEADNTAIRSALAAAGEKRNEAVFSVVEHPAIKNLVPLLRREGCRVTEIGVDQAGRLRLDKLREAVTERTAVVSLMWANNETGVIFPVEEAAAIAKEKGALFHTDAVQATGKLEIDLKRQADIDFLAISGHKLHAPKGIGVLYVRRGTRFKAHVVGGHQEGGRRGGTENVPYIVGLGEACRLAREHLSEEATAVARRRDRLEALIRERVPDTIVNGDREHRLPNTTNIGFQYVEGEAILLGLSEHGVAASSGSACTSGSLQPSHVLRAMGVPYTAIQGSVRYSLSRYNTDEEIERAAAATAEVIGRLREMSPFVNASS